MWQTGQMDYTLEAARLDDLDSLRRFRDRFALPGGDDGIYLIGNSLGPLPHQARAIVDEEMDKWAEMGVHGHFAGERPWVSLPETMREPMAAIVGGLPHEVALMNSLTVNLHLLMISFYQPTPERFKILVEDHAFPSDHFVVESQIALRGFDPATAMIKVTPSDGETLSNADILDAIADCGDELALVLLPGIQYYTGQVLPMAEIAQAAHAIGAKVGFDLAHAAGNIELALHDWDADFAAWCTYKYLNGGPGSIGGVFIHERYATDTSIHRLAGWWGHELQTRFEMDNTFVPPPSADGWMVSTPATFSTATLIGALAVFTEAGGMAPLRAKTEQLLTFCDRMLDDLVGDKIARITPREMEQRGCQISLEVSGGRGKEVFEKMEAAGIYCDWRYPNVIRVAFSPLYNSFSDVERFVTKLAEIVT